MSLYEQWWESLERYKNFKLMEDKASSNEEYGIIHEQTQQAFKESTLLFDQLLAEKITEAEKESTEQYNV